MKKFTMKSLMKDVLEDERAVRIIKKNLPMVMNHPRFIEIYAYSIEAVINDDMGSVVGLPKSVVKRICKQILELEEEG